MQARHVPERSCITCRTKRPKRELVRVVRTPGGEIKVDPSGRMNGRGAYFCRDFECWAGGVAKGKLGEALKATLPDGAKRQLMEYARAEFGARLQQVGHTAEDRTGA